MAQLSRISMSHNNEIFETTRATLLTLSLSAEGRLKNLVARNRGRRAAYGDWARHHAPGPVSAGRMDTPGTPRQGPNGRLELPRTGRRTVPVAERHRSF